MKIDPKLHTNLVSASTVITVVFALLAVYLVLTHQPVPEWIVKIATSAALTGGSLSVSPHEGKDDETATPAVKAGPNDPDLTATWREQVKAAQDAAAPDKQ